MKSVLGLQTDHFVDPAYGNTEQTMIQYVKGSVNSQVGDSDFQWVTQLNAQHAFGFPVLNYLNIKELYLSSEFEGQARIVGGRYRNTWSHLDQNWDMGLIQPIFNYNPLMPSQQGLSGLFIELGQQDYSALFFLSHVYIPNQNAGYELEGGEFKEANPWFNNPPQNITFSDKNIPVKYDVNKPDLSSIVFRSSYGAEVKFGQPNQGFFTQASYLYKPSNHLAVGFNGGVLNIPAGQGEVEILPQVYNHRVRSIDAGWGNKTLAFTLSYLDDQSERPEYEEGWIYQKVESAQFISPSIQFKVKGLKAGASYLKRDGGQVTDVGAEDVSGQGSLLGQRYPYKNAYRLFAELDLRTWGEQKVKATLQYTSEQFYKFEMLSMQVNYVFSKLWTMQGGLELLTDSQNTVEVSSFDSLSLNDRAYMGVAYVF